MPFEQVGVRNSGRLLVGPGSGLQEKPWRWLYESVFKRKPAPDLIRGGDRFASRKRVKLENLEPRFDFTATQKALESDKPGKAAIPAVFLLLLPGSFSACQNNQKPPRAPIRSIAHRRDRAAGHGRAFRRRGRQIRQ